MRKLMWLTLGFAASIASGVYFFDRQFYLLAAGLCALALAGVVCLLFRNLKARTVAMLLFGCVLAFLWLGFVNHVSYSRVASLDQKELALAITARDYSVATEYGARTDGRVEIDGKRYRITVYHDADCMLSPGDQITATFLLRSTLPQESGESEYLYSNRIFLTARASSEIACKRTEKLPLYGYAPALRQWISARIKLLFPEDTAGFAAALLLGQTDGIDYETDTAFKQSGIRHVIAVSGLHVTILFSLVYVFTLRRRYLSALIGLPVLFFFAAVAGFTPSITRACVMHAMMVIASCIDREYDPPTALSLAVLGMLIVNPLSICHVGFQLSVGCMAGILLFSERIHGWLMAPQRLGKCEGLLGRICTWFCAGISVSLSANVFTTVLCAFYFGMVGLLGMVTNLLTLWIITYIFYGILFACLVSLVWQPLGSWLAWVVAWGIRYVIFIAKAIGSIPLAAVYTYSPYIVFWLIAAYLLLAIYMLMKKKQPLLLCCCLVLSLSVSLLLSWIEPKQDECRVTVLDVGQGQCILLQSEGRNFLVDCGGDDPATAADAAAAMLLSQGISRLDGLILTHYDDDHAEGAVYLLQRLQTSVLILPDCRDEGQMQQKLLAGGAGPALSVVNVVRMEFGNVTLTLIPSQSTESDNDSGLCVLFQTENCDILITGDMSEKGELALLRQFPLPKLELLIVGHHGSKYSTCRELLVKTRPETAIISVGKDNYYGHPSNEVLQRLDQFGCQIYRTDLDGTVVYRR